MPKHLASWNQDRDVWEVDQMDLFSGRSDVFWETYPTQGMTRSGELFEHPTSAPRIAGKEFSLLPTPLSADSHGHATEGNLNRETIPLRAITHYFPHQ